MSWQLGLAGMAALTGRDLQRAARQAGGGERLWQAGATILGRLLKLDADQLDAVRTWRRGFDPGKEVAALAAAGVRWTPIGSGDYPAMLADIHDPPFGLFTVGVPLQEARRDAPIVAIVGSRRRRTVPRRPRNRPGQEASSTIGKR